MMKCNQLIQLLHEYPININKINNLMKILCVIIISWEVRNSLPSEELADNRLVLNVDVYPKSKDTFHGSIS